MMRRYLAVVGIILAVIVALGFWLKPSLQGMRDGVDGELTRFAQAKLAAGETAPAITSVDSTDWGIAASHFVHAGDLTFYCLGAYRVTVCGSPD
jgi:hypothetical protein